eukprot:TRINITY_DN14553_c0_g2_i2.p1 TRINITY_DN14553_c0_g2~~TRINITY_DN14553_c0_g2_i2.p1  ORF type:complete len:676 (+),score=249.77 TRINITY_DN14553_c0_g2_i2:56-2029(+)
MATPAKPPTATSPTGPTPVFPRNDLLDRLRQKAKQDRAGSVLSIGSSVRSLSDISEVDGLSPLADQVINLNVPMPSPDLGNSSPSMSRSSSKRFTRRMSLSLSSDCMDEGIGEALNALSRTLSHRGSMPSRITSTFTTPKISKQQSVCSDRLSMIPGVPIAEEPVSAKRLESVDMESRTAESRSSTPFSEDEFDSDELNITDVPELQNRLRFRIKQVADAVEMGQKLFAELKQLREEATQVQEERDLLVEENDELHKEQSEYSFNLKRIAQQLAESKRRVSQLEMAHDQQKEDMDIIREKLQEENEALERKAQEMQENAKWQEEKFVAVQIAAERAAPANEHVLAMRAVLINQNIRHRYYRKLDDWRINNHKRRQCYHVLRHNLHTTEDRREYVRELYFQRLVVFARKGMARKHTQSLALQEEERAARDAIAEESDMLLAESMNACALLGVLAWQVAVEEADSMTADLRGQQELVSECALLSEFEQKWRNDLLALTWQGIATLYGSALNTSMNEWVSCSSYAEEKEHALSCMRERWEVETKTLRDACASRDRELQSVSLQVKEGEARAQAAEAMVASHEQEIEKLRTSKVDLGHELVSLRELVEVTDAELAKARTQLEFQRERAKARAENMQGNAAVSPCLKQALSLIHTLRQKTEV